MLDLLNGFRPSGLGLFPLLGFVNRNLLEKQVQLVLNRSSKSGTSKEGIEEWGKGNAECQVTGQ